MVTATIGSSVASGALIAAALGCAGCPTAAPTTSQPAVQAPAPTVHEISNQWGNGLGCTPHGELLSLTGILVVRPFGKGTDGAVVKTELEEWVVSYRAKGVLLELAGERVVVTGRECDKQGESVFGRHLDLATLTEAARPARVEQHVQ